MRGFVSASVDGGSFVVGIGVGGSGRQGREKTGLSVSSSDPLLFAYRSRRWPTMAEEESARLWQVNRTIHELVKDRVSTREYASRLTAINASCCPPGIPSLGRGNRDGPLTVQAVVREPDG